MSHHPLRPGAGFSLHALLFYGLLRLLPHPWLRRAISAPRAGWVRWRHQGMPRDAPADAVAAVLGALRRDGTAGLPPALSDADLAAIQLHLAGCTAVCLTDDGRQVEARVHPGSRGIQRARYRTEDILACPPLLRLVNDPLALAVAGAALGCRPTVAALGLHWSHPSPAVPTDLQRFHRDVESPRFVKVFTYLTDVGPDDGPHRYVVGSHREAGRLRLTPYEGEALAMRTAGGALRTITGPAGTRFIEDTWGVHQGEPVRRGPRLLLDVMYAVGPVALYRYRPRPAPPGFAGDAYANRLFMQPAPPAGAGSGLSDRSPSPAAATARSRETPSSPAAGRAASR